MPETEQPTLVVGSQLSEHKVTPGICPLEPSLSFVAHNPPGATQSESIAQNFLHADFTPPVLTHKPPPAHSAPVHSLPIGTLPAATHTRVPSGEPSMMHISPPGQPHCGGTSLHGVSMHTPLLEADDAEDADDADELVDAPPAPPADELAPPAPPMPEDELDEDELGPVQPSSPPSPPLPEPNGLVPTAHAATAKMPSAVTVISTSQRAFIVLPHP